MDKTTQISQQVQSVSINKEAMQAFVDSFRKTKSKITVVEFYYRYKNSNHEAWVKCGDCGDFFDRKVDDRCPTCLSTNFKK